MKYFLILAALLAFLPLTIAAEENQIETIVIHGNYKTTDAEIIGLIPFKEGDTISAAQAEELHQQLMELGRFDTVDVTIRYTTLSMDGPVALIITVAEKTSIGNSLIFLPLVGSFEGYGFSYGVQTTLFDYFGYGERIGVPVTWGGTKQIGLELNLDENLPFADRFMIGGRYLVRDEHQVFDETDERLRLMSEIGWNLGHDFFLIGSYWYEDVTYAETLETTVNTASASLVFDSRRNTLFPYDAVYAAYTLSSVLYEEPFENALINDFDVRAYKRLFGQSVLAAQFKYQETDTAQPIFDKNFLGGDFWVRGYDEPDLVGDNFYVATLELRVPFSEVTSQVSYGMTLFYDYAGLWNVDQELEDAIIFEGAGIGGFLNLGAVNIVLELATPTGDNDGDIQFHGGATFKF